MVKRFPFFSNHPVLLPVLLLALCCTQCTKSAFQKTLHCTGKVLDAADHKGVPGCRLRFFKVIDAKGGYQGEELASTFSGADGSFSFSCETGGSNKSFACKIDSTPFGFEKDDRNIEIQDLMDERLFEKDDVNFNVFTRSFGVVKLQIVGDGDSPKLKFIHFNTYYFYHGCNTLYQFTTYGNFLINWKYTMYDANNPTVEFTRELSFRSLKLDTVYKEIHF